jgi:hypothetical protein
VTGATTLFDAGRAAWGAVTRAGLAGPAELADEDELRDEIARVERRAQLAGRAAFVVAGIASAVTIWRLVR